MARAMTTSAVQALLDRAGTALERGRGVEAAQDLADRHGRGAAEVAFVDGGVRDVAAAAAGDEDLGTQAPGSVERDNARGWRGATRPDGSHEPSGAGADDANVPVFGRAGRGHARRSSFAATKISERCSDHDARVGA